MSGLDPGASIVSAFEAQAARHPDRLAVAGADGRRTYAALDRAASAVARMIRSRLGAEDATVALLLPPGAAIVVAILGVLKAGKIYVALDPAYPEARTAYMLADCQARLLLTDARHAALARRVARDGQIIVADDVPAAGPPGDQVPAVVSGRTPALLLYTSGSTGNPKGVLHTHASILVETRNYTDDARIGPEDRLSLWHSFSFANSIRNLFAGLVNGAAVFPYDLPGLGLAPLPAWIRDNAITIIHTVATTFRALTDVLPADARFPGVRVLRLGGEAIHGADVERFKRHFPPPCVLMHVMGPTETLSIRRHFIDHAWAGGQGNVPVGYPVRDKDVRLLDEGGREVAPGEPGEIAVRSEYLAAGYWRRPDETRAAFLPDPAGGRARLYLTGDRGVMSADGCLTHLGRKDFQVKVRGHRVETAEVEAALLGLPSVKSAVVHAHPDGHGDQRLVAYVVPALGATVTLDEMRRALGRTLPAYMLPASVVSLPALPLLPTGKVDRRALPVPATAASPPAAGHTVPRDPTERALAEIWQDVLAVERVGIDDRFLDLGGDSLRAFKVLARAVEAFEVELSMADLFRTETVAQMAELIRRRRAEG
ncbi:MAG TPA: non-ribosomal peptide synthetase [Methylomirabilota bacterium]|nr:non-ribosomal peptide synthetase [Methylomirabilota bacterium]